MLCLTGMMKLARRVRRGVDVFACENTGQYHCEKGDPDHETHSFKHDMPRRVFVFVVRSDHLNRPVFRLCVVDCRKWFRGGPKAPFEARLGHPALAQPSDAFAGRATGKPRQVAFFWSTVISPEAATIDFPSQWRLTLRSSGQRIGYFVLHAACASRVIVRDVDDRALEVCRATVLEDRSPDREYSFQRAVRLD
jgi:hypothetical protein